MVELAKRLWLAYQRFCWYFSLAVQEAHKPLVLLNETALMTILASTFGFHPHWQQLAVIYLVLAIVSVIGGKLLVHFGVLAYNTKLSNGQNPEINAILASQKRIEAHLGISSVAPEDEK